MNYVDAINKFNKKEYMPIYIFYGDEKYLFESFVQRLEKLVSKPFIDFDMVIFSGDEYGLESVLDACEMTPIGSEYRIVLARDCRFFSKGYSMSKGLAERLKAYASGVNPTTILVFEAIELLNTSAAFKAINDKDCLVELGKVEKSMFSKWIVKQFKENGKLIDKATLQDFIGILGYYEKDSKKTLVQIKNEIDAISSATMDDVVRREDFEELSESAFFNSVFDLVDAVGMRNTEKSVLLYNGLVRKGKEPREIFPLIVRQFRILKRLKNIADNSFGAAHNKQVFDTFRLPAFTHKKYLNQIKYYEEYMIDNILEMCLMAEYDSKRRTGDFQRELETLIIKLCRVN